MVKKQYTVWLQIGVQDDLNAVRMVVIMQIQDSYKAVYMNVTERHTEWL